MTVAHDFQDLGVFFCACKRMSAKSFATRFQKCQSRFHKLQIMQWPHFRKSASLQRVVLPAITYGVELAHVSDSATRQLRGRCSSCLWGASSQRDHFLAPLVSAAHVYEPFLHIFQKRWNSIQRYFRRYAATACRRWNNIAQADHGHLVGPFAYFFEQVFKLGWAVCDSGLVVDHNGAPWSLFTDSWHRVASFAADAWCVIILPKIRKDDQFDGLLPFDLCLTRKALTDKKSYNSLIANFASGAIFKTKSKQHFLGQEDACCQLCGESGGAVHLLEDCPALALQRSQVQYNHIMHLPRAFRVSLLVPQPPDLQKHIADLCNLPHDDVGMLLPAGVHLFTDGSTMYGKEMTLAISSWAASLAELGSMESTCIVAAPLPGPVQTNNRAELYAVFQAVLSAPSGFLYSDSLVTVKGFRHLQKFGWVENQWTAAENYDLWHRLAQAVQDWSSWQITWIPSHRDAEAALSDWDAWCFHHINAVDILAKRANKSRSEQFLRRHAGLLSQQQRSSQQLDLVVNFQTQIAAVPKLGSSQRDTMARKPPGSRNAVDCTYLFLDRLGMLCNDKQCSWFAPNSFPEGAKFVHLPYARALWAFLESQTWVQDSGGCSILELYIAFFMFGMHCSKQAVNSFHTRQTAAAASATLCTCMGP